MSPDRRPRVLKSTSDRWRQLAHAASARALTLARRAKGHYAVVAELDSQIRNLESRFRGLSEERDRWRRIAEYSVDGATRRLADLRKAIVLEEEHAQELTDRLVAQSDAMVFNHPDPD